MISIIIILSWSLSMWRIVATYEAGILLNASQPYIRWIGQFKYHTYLSKGVWNATDNEQESSFPSKYTNVMGIHTHNPHAVLKDFLAFHKLTPFRSVMMKVRIFYRLFVYCYSNDCVRIIFISASSIYCIDPGCISHDLAEEHMHKEPIRRYMPLGRVQNPQISF